MNLNLRIVSERIISISFKELCSDVQINHTSTELTWHLKHM